MVTFQAPGIGTNFYNVNQAAGDGAQRVDFVINNQGSPAPYSDGNIHPIPDIAGCALWLRSDLGISLTGTTVNTWLDQSGSNNTASQATLSKMPTLITNDSGYNNQPILQFVSASAQFCSMKSVFPSQPFTIYIVGESTSGAGQQQFFGDSVNNVTGPYWSGANWDQFAGSNIVSTNFVQAKAQVFASIFNIANSKMFINTSAIAAAQGNNGATSPSGSEAIGGTGAGTITMNGKIVEMVIYSGVHTSAQVSTMFQYFAKRYNPGAWL